MAKKKYSIGYRSEIDFESGKTVEREETAEERAARLGRNSSARRSRILRKFRDEGSADFIDALSKALKMAVCEGQQFPLHFTIKFTFRKDGFKDTTHTERYTLLDAVTLEDLWTGEKTWSVWMKVLKTRKTDDGVELAFPVKEIVFNATK